MTCHYRNNDSNALLTCMGLTPIYGESDVAAFAHRVGSDPPFVYNYTVSCLRVNRLIRPDIPEGPCGNFVKLTTPEQQTFGQLRNLANRDPEPISHAVLAGLAQIGSFFSGIFSGAPSLRELQTQCAVTQGYNNFAIQAERGLAAGSVSMQDALVSLKQLQTQCEAQLQSVMGGHDSAPYFILCALRALVIFQQEVVYPNIKSQGSLSGIANAINSAVGGGNTALYVGGGLVAAKLFGII